MNKVLKFLILTITTMCLASCAGGLFSAPKIEVLSDPEGAEVTIVGGAGEQKVGKTPFFITGDHLDREDGGAIHINVSKTGFLKEQIFIDSRWFGKKGSVKVKLIPEANWEEAYQDENAYKYLNDVASASAEIQAITVKGDLAKAEQMARSLITRYPRLSAGWNLLGNIHYMQRRVSDAIAAYRKSLDINPENKEVRQVLERLGGTTGRN